MGGRERAIEALIDRDPQGSLYRASRVLDEAVPSALANRPNLITKEALVDQAFALSCNAIDSLEKFDLEFPKNEESLSKRNKEAFDGVTRERIFLYQTKIEGTSEKQASPPESLVAGLRKLYAEKIRQLLECVTNHAVFRGNSSNDNPKNFEKLIGAVIKLATDPKETDDTDARLQGLIIAILSLISTKNEEGNDAAVDEKVAAQPDSTTVPADFQVGALLALLDPDNEMLAYFAKAAAVSEERSEIQKARMLARLESPVAIEQPEATAEASCNAESVESGPSEEDEDGANQETGGEPNVVEDDDDEDDEEDEDDDEEDEDEDDEEAFESDMSDEDEGGGEDAELVLEPQTGDVLIDSDEEGPEDSGLQRALAVSATSCSALPSTPIPGEIPSPHIAQSKSEEDDEESSLPPFPKTPSASALRDSSLSQYLTFSQPDEADDRPGDDVHPILDPSNLSDFSRIPKYLVLRVLLSSAQSIVENMRFLLYNPAVTNETVPGGMGSSLFANEAKKLPPQKSHDDLDLTLQLLVAAFVLLEEKRNDAITNFQKAVARELHVGQDGDVSSDDDVDASDFGGTSGEADDPALALAMNYVEDDVPLSSESLENKGMRRKAAAAAHELSVMIETSRKHTSSCRTDVRNVSQSLLCITRTLRHFLESTTRRNLLDKNNFSAINFPLPASVTEKLGDALERLTSPSLTMGATDLELSREQDLLSVELYKDSLGLWAASLPLVNPSASKLAELLKTCVISYTSMEKKTIVNDVPDFNTLKSFPSSRVEELAYRLRFLCDRFRTADVLNELVPRPALYNVEDDETQNTKIGREIVFGPLVSLLKSSSTINGFGQSALRKLYLALCHCCNTKVILLDGFYAATEAGRVGSSNLKTVNTGDTLRVNSLPSKELQFDSTKCRDSIALISGFGESAGSTPGNSSVHQRASKVWGAALTTNHYSPRTGVHRWAVRLDKCERGHVFLGVATSQASTLTYVGGDRYGWGLIGTQALWHDRRKIRGDYGAPFKTGSTIVITLDTDAGTLRFSSWKDNSTTNSFSLDPNGQGMFSPKKTGYIGGVVEDWGIAFEGLPLDAKLYPAVGLYQRDDRLTILSVENPAQCSGWGVHGGSQYYPLRSFTPSHEIEHVSKTNELLTLGGIQYAADILKSTPDKPQTPNDGTGDISTLKGLAASLCLLPPSVPILSNRAAVVLLPHLARSILELEEKCPRPRESSLSLFLRGKWTIRATGSSSTTDHEEYVVDFTVGTENGDALVVQGEGVGTTGKSKNGSVSIVGCVNGLALTFIERWNDANEGSKSKTSDDASSCVASARMGLDGTRFDGFYRNVRDGSSGRIVGIRCSDANQDEANQYLGANSNLEVCRHLLCLAHSHLSSVLAEDTAGDFQKPGGEQTLNTEELMQALSVFEKPTFAHVSLPASPSSSFGELQLIRNTLSLSSRMLSGIAMDEMLVRTSKELVLSSEGRTQLSEDASRFVADHDKDFVTKSGGTGSFRSLNPQVYDKTRQEIVASFLYHCKQVGDLCSLSYDDSSASLDDFSDLLLVWRSALKLLEDGIRISAAKNLESSRRDCLASTCAFFREISKFLMSLEVEDRESRMETTVEAVLQDVQFLYSKVESEDSLSFITKVTQLRTQRGFLRLASLDETANLVSNLSSRGGFAVEPTVVAASKVLGRRLAESGDLRHGGDHLGTGIPGGVFSGLAGSSRQVKHAIRERFCSFVGCVGRLIGNIVETRENEDLSIASESQYDSLLLILLSLLVGRVEPQDLDRFLQESGALKVLPRIFALYRRSLVHSDPGNDYSAIRDLWRRDVSRSILRCGLALAHIVHYHLLIGGNSISYGCRYGAVDLVRVEVAGLVSLIEENFSSTRASAFSRKGKDDMDTWMNSVFPGVTPIEKGKVATSPCLDFLAKYGTMLSSMSMGNTTGTKKEVSHQRSHATSFIHQFFNSWLHVIAIILDSELSLDLVAGSDAWFTMFLTSLGISIEGEILSETKLLLPVRFRARILRLIYPLLAKRPPSNLVVRRLLELAGTSSSSSGRDEGSVSREAVSLLRKLHSPLHPRWKDEAQLAFHDVISRQSDGATINGLMAFLSGDLAPLSVGSFVLIKPTEASSLSPDPTSSNGKGQPGGPSSTATTGPSFGTIPHHIVGNGTEPLVAGLSKDGATGGVVSSIDLKNAMCEVVLVERFGAERITVVDGQVHSWARPITVRAIRTHLADTVQAQEISLYLDDSFSFQEFCTQILEPTVDSFFSRFWEEGGEGEFEPATSTSGLMALRSSIVCFSNARTFKSWESVDVCRRILNKVLKVASPQDVRNPKLLESARSLSERGLSNLPCHEARYGHVVSLLRELSIRLSYFDDVPIQLQARVIEGLKGGRPIASKSDSETKVPELVRQNEAIEAGRSVSQSTGGSNSDDDDENETAATEAAHLREAAIAQMAELGLPRSWSEFALRRTGGVNIEAAVAYCLERGPEIERLLLEEQESGQRDTSGSSSRRRASRDARQSSQLLKQLLEMGFPRRWCTEALAVTGNNVDEALTWILSNGERLSEEDEAIESGEAEMGNEEGEESAQDEEDETELGESTSDLDTDAAAESSDKSANENEMDGRSIDTETPAGWTGSIIPLRFISGRAIVDTAKMEVSGLPSGGFSSVGTKGVLLTSGKWYYEAVLETAGCLQIGWADGSFAGHCHADRGDGCGDGPSSWAFDGWRRYRWHATATEWGCRWKEGDVVGCLVDMDDRTVSFTLNGKGESIGMGVAFAQEGFRPCGGVYACVSFNRREKLRLILGGKCSAKFKHQPEGYRGVGEAILESVEELQSLLHQENVLQDSCGRSDASPKKFLCDFSDGEHGHELMAWTHRYYGSDASVQLGSGRHKQSSSRYATCLSSADSVPAACVTRKLRKEWSEAPLEDDGEHDFVKVLTKITAGFVNARKSLVNHLNSETFALVTLLARKLILHVVIADGERFDPRYFSDGDRDTLKFWKCIESSTSLRDAGWINEAGAMALAAEALGLGISSSENSQLRGIGERHGTAVAADIEENLLLPACGASQILTSVMMPSMFDGFVSPAECACAYAEAAVCSDGGSGILSFLKPGLRSAVGHSTDLRRLLVAFVRSCVRSVSEVEYVGEDFESSRENGTEESGSQSKPETVIGDKPLVAPDARLAAFITGLLLCRNSSLTVDSSFLADEECALFEAWSVGLLSSSLPWRMVCLLTAAGILKTNPSALGNAVEAFPTIRRYLGRLRSTTSRRLWAERAALPVVSRYAQALIELTNAVEMSIPSNVLHSEFMSLWKRLDVDAATPLPICDNSAQNLSWEVEEGWVSGDTGWDVWVGTVEQEATNWKVPPPSSVHRLMDGGEGPPMLREGSVVMRGVDWDQEAYGNDDGKDLYDNEKATRGKEKEAQKKVANEKEEPVKTSSQTTEPDSDEVSLHVDPADESSAALDSTGKAETAGESQAKEAEAQESADKPKKKTKRVPGPKLPIGKVLSIEPWDGVPGMGRQVKWIRTGKVGIYRFGGGSKFDLCHVEVKSRQTKVKKRHPLPESNEQCAARHGFGVQKSFKVLLRIQMTSREQEGEGGEPVYVHQGILEWPDFGAGVAVSCTRSVDGTIYIEEGKLLYGAKDSGWEALLGQPVFAPSSPLKLRLESATNDVHSPSCCLHEVLGGERTQTIKRLRNPRDGTEVSVKSIMALKRTRWVPSKDFRSISKQDPLPPITFDRDFHGSSLAISLDGKTVSCAASDGRATAFGTIGFTKGVHYWEMKIENTTEIGNVFIGVAEKPTGSGSGSSFRYDSSPKLNRWHGWGFCNFRATYASGAERVYGSHCHSGDTVGVLLDCDAGRISFFFDGLKFGEHVLNDLGCAFENLSPFGFNVDGCGSGGAGQGSPSGFESGSTTRYQSQGATKPRTLWPVVGLKNKGDRVTFSSKWSSVLGIDGSVSLGNVNVFGHVVDEYTKRSNNRNTNCFPDWFVKEAYHEYRRFSEERLMRSTTRGSGPLRMVSFGLDVDFDSSPIACASASASLGLDFAVLAGDRVKLRRSAGRVLELDEEAVVLGTFQGRLYYRIVSQKSEGGSLTEGGGRAWCWDESEVVGGLQFVFPSRGRDIKLPKLSRFASPGALKIIYSQGAVLRSDLEILENSGLGTIPVGTLIPQDKVLERRVNSCGVVRFRVVDNDLGEGWISARIRGGSEEHIVEVVEPSPSDPMLPYECARKWYEEWSATEEKTPAHQVISEKEFRRLLVESKFEGKTILESDALLVEAINVVSNFSNNGDSVECSFRQVASALSFTLSLKGQATPHDTAQNPTINQAVASIFAGVPHLPSLGSLLSKVAILRAFNRRARLALPWISMRPCQEGSALFGGLLGHGASADRTGRSSVPLVKNCDWTYVPSLSTEVRHIRKLLFTSVKREILQSVVEATTTPTLLSHDEFDLPRDIRTVRVNRLRANRVMSGTDNSAKRKYSVLSQLYSETKSWGGAALRRGYVAKGHGGQKRAFKVKFVGEGVNDYSGPYREAFTDAMAEILKTDEEGRGVLGVLDRTPNNATSVGNDRDYFMFSQNNRILEHNVDQTNLPPLVKSIRESFSTLLLKRDEASREVEESLVFLGRLVGTAYRHGIAVDLPLPLATVWRTMAEESTSTEEKLRELDFLAARQYEGKSTEAPIIMWQKRMLNSFAEGLSHVLPVELLCLLSGEELRDAICGNSSVDVGLLKEVAEYEGFESDDEVVGFFWATLEEMTNEERKTFLQFVWARNRLPMRESDFDAPFKIVKDTKNAKHADDALPSASTCFFSLSLPEYSSREILRSKLMFAISNVATMETDFQTNNAEIAEGYRDI